MILPSVVVIVLAVGATWLLRDRLRGRARRVFFGEWTPSGFTTVPLSGQACNDPLELDS